MKKLTVEEIILRSLQMGSSDPVDQINLESKAFICYKKIIKRQNKRFVRNVLALLIIIILISILIR